jgi:CheY-like chemotaxis protein
MLVEKGIVAPQPGIAPSRQQTLLAHEQGPEVILLDPMLPDRSGCELYASLQRDPATLAIPVLFLPGETPPVATGDGVVPWAARTS